MAYSFAMASLCARRLDEGIETIEHQRANGAEDEETKISSSGLPAINEYVPGKSTSLNR